MRTLIFLRLLLVTYNSRGTVFFPSGVYSAFKVEQFLNKPAIKKWNVTVKTHVKEITVFVGFTHLFSLLA